MKDLQFLLAAYLEPLKKEHFWNYADLEQLYKNVKEIFIFQTKFLRILEESLESDPGFCSHTALAQFKVRKILSTYPGPYLHATWSYIRILRFGGYFTTLVSLVSLKKILKTFQKFRKASENFSFEEIWKFQ